MLDKIKYPIAVSIITAIIYTLPLAFIINKHWDKSLWIFYPLYVVMFADLMYREIKLNNRFTK